MGDTEEREQLFLTIIFISRKSKLNTKELTIEQWFSNITNYVCGQGKGRERKLNYLNINSLKIYHKHPGVCK